MTNDNSPTDGELSFVINHLSFFILGKREWGIQGGLLLPFQKLELIGERHVAHVAATRSPIGRWNRAGKISGLELPVGPFDRRSHIGGHFVKETGPGEGILRPSG